MREKSNSKENITPTIVCKSPWHIVHVEPLPNYQLNVQFVDDTAGIVDIANLINGQNAGVFEALKDRNLFAKVYIHLGVVTWPTKGEFEIDLAPDAMYNSIKKTGSWIL
jgi:hypothetical protein